uniref:Pre-mRNA splicing Prp18-interacting factor n=1 Tax=Tanacetum cinerariifolium TaxID=118510 RepID=A0A6L2L4V9_TANCI|nr:hypothetical protein [Tanacetum cinerariifolium]
MSSFYEFICYGCGGPLDTPLCYLYTCEQCGNILIHGTCLKCNSGAGNSFTYVENLIPNPSEFEDLSDSVCDVLAYDDFTTFSNLLFDADDDFSCSDNESLFNEDISKEIYSNPLFDEEIISMKIDSPHFNAESDLIESLLNHDSLIISCSSKIDSLLDEFVGELILLKSIPSGIDETDCDPEEEIHLIEKLLYDNSSPRPPEEFISKNSDAKIKSFSPSPIPVEDSHSFMEEINLTLTPDDSMPPGFEDDDYDSKKDILILEKLLSNDSLSLPENEWTVICLYKLNERFSRCMPTIVRYCIILKLRKTSPGKIFFRRRVDLSRRMRNSTTSPHILSHRGLKPSQLSSENSMMMYGRNTQILDVPFLYFYPP